MNFFGKTHRVLHQIGDHPQLGIRKQFTFTLETNCGHAAR